MLALRARSTTRLYFNHLHHHLITLSLTTDFLTTKILLTTREHSLTIFDNRPSFSLAPFQTLFIFSLSRLPSLSQPFLLGNFYRETEANERSMRAKLRSEKCATKKTTTSEQNERARDADRRCRSAEAAFRRRAASCQNLSAQTPNARIERPRVARASASSQRRPTIGQASDAFERVDDGKTIRVRAAAAIFASAASV